MSEISSIKLRDEIKYEVCSKCKRKIVSTTKFRYSSTDNWKIIFHCSDCDIIHVLYKTITNLEVFEALTKNEFDLICINFMKKGK